MKKISLFMVIMLIALMVFVGCDNNKVKERKATPEDAEVFLAFYYGASTAIDKKLSGTKQVNMTDYTFDNVQIKDDRGENVIIVLNGNASVEVKEGVAIVHYNVLSGSSYKNVGHTMNCNISLVPSDNDPSKKPVLKSYEIILDGYKITGLDSTFSLLFD